MQGENKAESEISRRYFCMGSVIVAAGIASGGMLAGCGKVATAPQPKSPEIKIKTVDVHSHIIPPEYTEAVRKAGVANEDGFPAPEWNLEEHLNFMDQAEIELSILSLSSPHQNFGNNEESRVLSRRINETTAAIKQKYPKRFGFNAVLPLPDVEGSLEEITHAFDVLKADGIKLSSNSRGVYLGDPLFEPIFAELNKRNAVVNIHPCKPSAVPANVFTSGLLPLFEFIADTTRAVINLITSGTITRYPNVKIVVPHCGSFLPGLVERLAGITEILTAQGVGKPVNVMDSVKMLYFDIAGTPLPRNFDTLLTMVDPSKVMYGSDYPFTPAPAIIANKKAIMAYEPIDKYKAMIFRENALQLFKRL
ncbi:amidohydrolase family protein [Desulfosporosinus shakirovi]|uniref:amidohydrolase family protein n=1 Tax=Desulfosporosinus shakirovi TaxID=2885154 RepID=UPI001E35A904|nr:amidohydrolase family protein [Desulfosporosinus sp. SRJS8]MCB8817838.1 amidohydrolase [Desulfosporosinus sp. SRJS8]